MTPGMSLPAKDSGRSIAPVAVMMRPARMRHSRCFGPPVAGRVVGHLLVGQHIAVVIDPGPHAAQAQRDIGHRRQALQRVVDPDLGRLAVDLDRRRPARGRPNGRSVPAP